MKRICGECGKRPAKFRYRRWVRADDDHWVCFKCWRGLRQSHQEGLKIMQRTFDAMGNMLSDALFAEAYRATIPLLADAKHVTVRACSARLAELSGDATDISDVVEIGTAKDNKVRVVAVPVSVHVDDGAAVIQDDKFDPKIVSFEVNGIPEVQIINLRLSRTEQAALDQAAAAQKAKEDANAKSDFDKQLEAAKEEGRKQALLDQAKAAGAASVAKTEPPTSSEPPVTPPTVQ
jgi:hypothetical protein